MSQSPPPLTGNRPPFALLLRLSRRYLARHPWQVGLALIGVALGVAMLVAVELATASARTAFKLSAEQVAGKTTHQVLGGPAGLDPFLAAEVREALSDVPEASAGGLIETRVSVEDLANGTPSLTLLGVEPGAAVRSRPELLPQTQQGAGAGSIHILGSLVGRDGVVTLRAADFQPTATPPAKAAETSLASAGMSLTDAASHFPPPGGLILSASTAATLGTAPGKTLRLKLGAQVKEVLVLATLDPTDPTAVEALDGLLLADVGTVMGWMARERVDRLDLILPEGPQEAALEARVKELLPPEARLTRPSVRTQGLSQLTAAFEVNLQALSFLALIVGMFLIYNTITFSVVQRRGLIGTLRCLGLTRREVFWQVVLEALLIGLVGTAFGLALGVVLGRGLVGLVTQTINDLYFAVTVKSVSLTPLAFLKGGALGIVATTFTAMLPAREATQTPPRMALRRSSTEEQMRKLLPMATGAGIALLLACVLLLNVKGGPLELSFLMLLCGILGAASLTPALTLISMNLLRPPMGRLFGLLGRMASRDIVAHLSRTSIAIAALMIAVSVSIGIGLMVGSFRQTVVEWLEYQLQADIYVSVPGPVNSRSELVIPAELEARVRAHPELMRIRVNRRFLLETPQGRLEILGTDLQDARDREAFRLVDVQPGSTQATEIWQAYDRGDILITEPLAARLHLKVGDLLPLATLQGVKPFRVAGIYYDYATDQGMVNMPETQVRALFGMDGLTAMGLHLKPEVNVEAFVKQLRQEVPAGMVANIRSTRTLKDGSMQIFDRTFAITYVLQLLATGVAFIGILSALMALQLERARELAVLRATGLTPGQLWGLVLTQTGLMGAVAGVLSIPVGIGMAWLLIFVINARSFGWSMPLHLDGALFVQAVVGAVFAAVLAGIYPAWRMSRTPPALALREE